MFSRCSSGTEHDVLSSSSLDEEDSDSPEDIAACFCRFLIQLNRFQIYISNVNKSLRCDTRLELVLWGASINYVRYLRGGGGRVKPHLISRWRGRGGPANIT